MGKLKELLQDIEEVNTELALLAEDERDAKIQEIFEEILNDHELQRQYEALAHARDLEDFSPFDTVNS